MTSAFRQSFDHKAKALKGWIPGNMGSLDCTAKLSANVTIDPVYAGRVVHKNSSGEFEMGCIAKQMGIVLIGNSDDRDVSMPTGDDYQTVFPPADANLTGLVCSGGFEIESTEYDTAQTYAYNDLLRAVASNSSATTGGRLTNQSLTLYTNAAVGVVSRTPYYNAHRKQVIAFWTVYCPAPAA